MKGGKKKKNTLETIFPPNSYISKPGHMFHDLEGGWPSVLHPTPAPCIFVSICWHQLSAVAMMPTIYVPLAASLEDPASPSAQGGAAVSRVVQMSLRLPDASWRPPFLSYHSRQVPPLELK